MNKLIIASLILIAALITHKEAQASMRPQIQCSGTWGVNDPLTAYGESDRYIHNDTSYAFIRATKSYGRQDWGRVTMDDNGGDTAVLHIDSLIYRDITIDREQDVEVTEGDITIKCHVYRIKDLNNAYAALKKVSQPKIGEWQKSSKSTNHWMYGSKSFPYAKVIETTYEVKADAGFGNTYQNVSFIDFAAVVGFEIESNWHDGSNANWFLDYGGMGEQRCFLEFGSRSFRGMSYTVKIYWVPNSEISTDWHFNIIDHPA